ncbi:formin-like protein 7 [Rhododendron vialii]|uniref:formin-like protein 7 n=1 Tax=Rhododendron vialii TaxID=182163 RepID=UPI0026602DF1|nr:formin-like protein 7 [Rhododendron vialii]
MAESGEGGGNGGAGEGRSHTRAEIEAPRPRIDDQTSVGPSSSIGADSAGGDDGGGGHAVEVGGGDGRRAGGSSSHGGGDDGGRPETPVRDPARGKGPVVEEGAFGEVPMGEVEFRPAAGSSVHVPITRGDFAEFVSKEELGRLLRENPGGSGCSAGSTRG